MKKTFAYALLILTALYSCEEGKSGRTRTSRNDSR